MPGQIVDDPTGNSFVENLHAPAPDPNMQVTNYQRSRLQNQLIGLLADDDDGEEKDEKEKDAGGVNSVSLGTERERNGISCNGNGNGNGIGDLPEEHGHEEWHPDQEKDHDEDENPLHVDPNELIKGEALEFVTNCNNCSTPCITRMKVTGTWARSILSYPSIRVSVPAFIVTFMKLAHC